MPTSESHRRRAPEERPTQILDAAFHEFGEHGLAGARLDDIAKRAQVAKGTIYLYFPNKEALFREMVHTTIVTALAEGFTSVSLAQAILLVLVVAFLQWKPRGLIPTKSRALEEA